MRNNYIKYYRFLNNETSVTEVSVNDFKLPVARRSKRAWLNGFPVDILCSLPFNIYSLPTNETITYGYTDRAKAISMANATAMSHIQARILEIKQSIKRLKQIDVACNMLNFSLLRKRLQELQQELKA